MEVEIVSREYVKPSSPTPSHLKIHKLSLLDQCSPSTYVAMLLFYQNPKTRISPQQISLPLKLSLSQVLTLFYPFAGKIRDRFSVDCDDHGVQFTQANARFPLFNFLHKIDLHFLSKFLPAETTWAEHGPGANAAMVQVTNFCCGGFVIGALVSHIVADGTAVSVFLRSWATLCRESESSLATKPPNYEASHLFPQTEDFPEEARLMSLCYPFLKQGKCGVRRFVFGPSAIRALKDKAGSQSVLNPTRVEVVSGHLCRCIISAFEAKSDCKSKVVVTQTVNLRRRAVPQFPEESMGNFLWVAAVPKAGEKGNELGDLVSQLREAIAKIDGRLVESLGEEKRSENLIAVATETRKAFSGAEEGGEFIGFTSWCNFGLYEVDFGWGKPIWVSCVGSPMATTVFMNTVVLMDTRSRDGVEAWVFLDEDDIALLERSQDLLAFAALDQTPLQQD